MKERRLLTGGEVERNLRFFDESFLSRGDDDEEDEDGAA